MKSSLQFYSLALCTVLLLLFSNYVIAQPIFCPSCEFLQCESGKICKVINGCGSCILISNSSSSSSSSSSSGSFFNIDENFTGVWKSQPIKIPTISSSSSGSCIACNKVNPTCSNKEILVPQACNSCAYCIKKDFLQSINLRLCIQNGKLDGLIDQKNVFNSSILNIDSVPSKKILKVSSTDSAKSKHSLTFNLINSRKMSITLPNGLVTQAIKTGTNGCLFPICSNLFCQPVINGSSSCKVANMLLESGCGDCPIIICP